MDFALSTNWNSMRHEDGGGIVDEALSLGFDSLELSYRLTNPQFQDIKRRAASGGVRLASLHAPCPRPGDGTPASPEPFSLTALEESERRKACALVFGTLNAAVDAGVKTIVVHAGHVSMGKLTERVAKVRRRERPPNFIQRFLIDRLMRQRVEKAEAHMDALRRSLSELLPAFDDAKVTMALENLPYWEGVPDEPEMERLLEEFQTPRLRYWHDMGHGQVRENLGICDHLGWVEHILPFVAGCHIHDVIGLMSDHHAPGQGGIDFSSYRLLGAESLLHVFEPAPDVEPEALAEGLSLLRRLW